jgi:pantothenate kinase
VDVVAPDDIAGWIVEHRGTSDRFLFGIAGPPGSGKSTLAASLAAELSAPVVAMDGFHLPNDVLRERGQLGVKGAPETFDGLGFVDLVRRLRGAEGVIECPTFDRTIDEPVSHGVRLGPEHTVVIVEGNYLLLDEVPWRELSSMLDAIAYLDVPDEVRTRRLIDRHVRFGRDRTEAAEFVRRSDGENARLVERDRARADVVITVGPSPEPPGTVVGLRRS